MAANDFIALKGPFRVIRPIASANRSKGHFELLGPCAGFWLHDVANGAEGSYCVAAGLVSMTRTLLHSDFRSGVAITAGSVLFLNAADRRTNVRISDTAAGQGDRQTPGVIGIVYRNASTTDTRLLVSFEHH